MSVAEARQIVENARLTGVFPAAALEIGSSDGSIWSEAFATNPDTPFDLASLTKVIATTTLVMELTRVGALDIEERISPVFPEWLGADREGVTVRDLLEHASGLPARLIDAPPAGGREFEHDICATPLEYVPRSRSIYSDLGFILLGFFISDRGGAPLDVLYDRLALASESGVLTYRLPTDVRALAAPTQPMSDDVRRGRIFVGEVHDNYAAALGGAAGHAGLFGTASAVGGFARLLLRAARFKRSARSAPAIVNPFSPELVATFTAKGAVPGSSRALGWDTMLPTSSCGTRMSADAFGHVGFTGTSLWIDPMRDRYFVLLTNRVCGGGTLNDMRTVRRSFHDALGDV